MKYFCFQIRASFKRFYKALIIVTKQNSYGILFEIGKSKNIINKKKYLCLIFLNAQKHFNSMTKDYYKLNKRIPLEIIMIIILDQSII